MYSRNHVYGDGKFWAKSRIQIQNRLWKNENGTEGNLKIIYKNELKKFVTRKRRSTEWLTLVIRFLWRQLHSQPVLEWGGCGRVLSRLLLECRLTLEGLLGRQLGGGGVHSVREMLLAGVEDRIRGLRELLERGQNVLTGRRKLFKIRRVRMQHHLEGWVWKRRAMHEVLCHPLWGFSLLPGHLGDSKSSVHEFGLPWRGVD